MMIKDLKKKRGELGVVLNTFDVEKLTEYMKTTDLFKESYKGKLRTLRLPRCLKKVDFYTIDLKVKYIENLVIPPETEYVDDNVCKIEKENADGSVSEMKMRLECDWVPYLDD